MAAELESLEASLLNAEYELRLKSNQRKYVEQKDFEVYIIDLDGCHSIQPVVRGIFSAGRESIGIKEWMDIEYFEFVSFGCGRNLDLSASGLDLRLYNKLGSLISAGGSIMVAYQMFQGKSRVHEDTDYLLQHAIMPEATPIGYLLIHAGCLSFKDWYWPEGGREGPQKLQGFKPINKEQAKIKISHIINSLQNFLAKQIRNEKIMQAGQERAKVILELLKSSASA